MKGRWTVLAFLCAIFVTYTVDRALLGILAKPIQDELGLTNGQLGILSAAVFWTYAICVPFSGLAGDRFDRAKLIGLAAVAWSAMTLLAGFASGFWSLFILFSVAICAPQTLYGPSANALVSEYHRETRTIALSCHQAAYYTGWFVSGSAVAGILALFGSWRAAFFVCGSVGLVLGVAFLRWQRGVQRTGQVSLPSGVSRPPACGRSKPTVRQSLRAFFGCKFAEGQTLVIRSE